MDKMVTKRVLSYHIVLVLAYFWMNHVKMKRNCVSVLNDLDYPKKKVAQQ